MESPGSPDFETASAIQALALADSAMRSARQGALSFRPPASTYCWAILPRERQFGDVSYFEVLSRTSMTQRLTASLSWVAIASSCDSLEEQPDISGKSRKSGSRRLLGLMSVSSKDGAACVRGLRWFDPYAGESRGPPFSGLAMHHGTQRWHKSAVPDRDLRFGDCLRIVFRSVAGSRR